MLLLLQSYPRRQGQKMGGVRRVEDDTDEIMLMIWFTFMQRYYAK
jgi:hypothetical protein